MRIFDTSQLDTSCDASDNKTVHTLSHTNTVCLATHRDTLRDIPHSAFADSVIDETGSIDKIEHASKVGRIVGHRCL